MILMDLQQVILATYAKAMSSGPKVSSGPGAVRPDAALFRHMALNSIRSINNRHRSEYGELVLCDESFGNWRKQVFPYYKARRERDRAKSPIDWAEVRRVLGEVKQEFEKNLPYRYLSVPGCEADDVIGVLATSRRDERVLIVSSDGDFVQLQRIGLRQWDPIHKRWLESPDPSKNLKSKIIRGDSGDGVPNFLSDDDTFVVEGKRSRPIRQTDEQRWLDMTPEAIAHEVGGKIGGSDVAMERWRRNDTLVNLNNTPSGLVTDVLDKYEGSRPTATKQTLLGYFADNGLKQMAENLQDF
jgi:Kyanoviridae ribonuclease H